MIMKTAIVFYSMGGNTALAAGRLAEALSADLIELRPKRAYPNKGFRKFFWGGKSAVMGDSPELEPYIFHAEEYGRIIFGFPVWAASIAPPIRTFLRENLSSLKDKEIAAFACQSGSGAEKALKKLADCMRRDSLSPVMILIDPRDRPSPENDRKIAAFLAQLSDGEKAK